ncbi:MAG: acyl-CoA dehydrogenase family protein [Acidimicrobiales bacterium]
MDFTLDEDQQAVADLAGRILGDKCPPERLREMETDPEGRWFAADAWSELAKADLLGLALPGDVGGGGYGFLEACLLLEQQGRHAAPLPLLATLVLGALPIARFGNDALRQRWLPGVIDGTVILTAALAEPGDYLSPEVPTTTATPEGDGWTVDGEKVFVPAADLADAILVPAATSTGATGVFVVDRRTPGVALERNVLVSGEPVWTVRLTRVPTHGVVGDVEAGGDVLRWMVQRAVAGLCMTQVGVADAALRLTADYVGEREQFGSKIGTFQAVAQRIADAYIDAEGIRLTALQAAWRLADDLPADEELHIAKFWAADGGHRLVHACQHLHGGIGVDLDYPVHRYFRWTKAIEFTLGSGTEHLRRLGRRIAAQPG